MSQYVIQDAITGNEIRQLRGLLGMSQRELAGFLRCSVRTVEYWESKEEKITGPLVPLVEILLRKPELVRKLELPPNRLKLRLWYYYRQMVCTVIDVDELTRITNATPRNCR